MKSKQRCKRTKECKFWRPPGDSVKRKCLSVSEDKICICRASKFYGKKVGK